MTTLRSGMVHVRGRGWLPVPARSWELLAILAIAGVAAFVFLWQLGSSSFFIDEAQSMQLADEPFERLLSRVRVAENTPAGYFALLHLWKGLLGSNTEWAARLPSALAGV